MKGRKTLGRVGKTHRGFELVKFKDFNGAEAILQGSTISSIWLGLEAAVSFGAGIEKEER